MTTFSYRGKHLHAEPVSEIDAGWETSAHAYRVYFWTKLREATAPGAAPLWQSEACRISGTRAVDVILSWAIENAGGREVTIYLEVAQMPPMKSGLVHIYGNDPTAPLDWE